MSDAMETLAAIVTLEGEIERLRAEALDARRAFACAYLAKETDNKRLRAINAELLTALEDMWRPIGPDSVDDIERFMREGGAIAERARAAIARAKS